MKLRNKMSHKFSKEISFFSLPGYHAYSGIQKFGGGKYPGILLADTCVSK